MTRVTRRFAYGEFTAIFRRAASRCYEFARAEYCEPPLPERLCFYIPELDPRCDYSQPSILRVPAACLMHLEDTLPLLLREDGLHRPDIRLSPVAVTEEETILEVRWDGEWTDWLPSEKLAFPYEPFIVLGPAMPLDWNFGDPTPRVSLPRLESLPQDFDWSLHPEDCEGIDEDALEVRREAALRLCVKLSWGFTGEHVAEVLVARATAEEEPEVRRALARVLLHLRHEGLFALWQRWMCAPDKKLRLSAYGALREQYPKQAFPLLFERLAHETDRRGQIFLLRSLYALSSGAEKNRARLLGAIEALGLQSAWKLVRRSLGI